MKERPILFSGAMVRALLAGSKTQTRRLVKPQPETAHDGEPYWFIGGYRAWGYRPAPAVPLRVGGNPLPCPYGQRGDRLWVRETHAPQSDCWGAWDRWMKGEGGPGPILHYAADSGERPFIDHWRPSIHMPRWASRITLEITSVRVERLQDISDADCVAEGCGALASAIGCPMTSAPGDTIPRAMYRALWESINGSGSWDANPWVWAVEFRKITP